jgi:hypothetical protein
MAVAGRPPLTSQVRILGSLQAQLAAALIAQGDVVHAQRYLHAGDGNSARHVADLTSRVLAVSDARGWAESGAGSVWQAQQRSR